MDIDDVTVVLLPGLNGTKGLFDPLIDASMGECKIHVISYPTHSPKSYCKLSEYVEEKLTSLSGRYILVGESFSGPISIFLTSKNLKGHIGTVLAASFCSPPKTLLAKYLPWTLGFLLAKPLYWLRIKTGKIENNSILKSISVEMQKISPHVLAHRIQSIFSVSAEKDLESCCLPMTYFRGNKDLVVPKWNLDKIISINPKIDVVYFDTEHFLLQSRPKEAWQEIMKFINNAKRELLF